MTTAVLNAVSQPNPVVIARIENALTILLIAQTVGLCFRYFG